MCLGEVSCWVSLCDSALVLPDQAEAAALLNELLGNSYWFLESATGHVALKCGCAQRMCAICVRL